MLTVIVVLGASLHDILTRLKAQPTVFAKINVVYSPSDPLVAPIILELPQNGMRLRFDGPDQRLRLVEILDFSFMVYTYKGVELIRLSDAPEEEKRMGPTFRQVYHKLCGPTFPGEYVGPSTASSQGTYVLSYPGLAFSFSYQDSAWSSSKDFVTLLSSSAASPAKSLAIFNGSSWQDARQDLYTRACPHPRSLLLGGKGREFVPSEVELVMVCGRGRVELFRRAAATFVIQVGETTPQDLVAELGPPDAIHRKYDRRLSIHKHRAGSRSDRRPKYASPVRFDGQSDTDRSSAVTSGDESDSEDDSKQGAGGPLNQEYFYNYFRHGLDFFISNTQAHSTPLCPDGSPSQGPTTSMEPVVAKILLHGNIPGSYPFNRYRRSRWLLDPSQLTGIHGEELSSETPFSELAKALQRAWKDTFASAKDAEDFHRGMVLNRGWGDSPGSSCELLGGWEETANFGRKAKAAVSDTSSVVASGLGNTELFGFQGLLFEVLRNDSISCLTVY
ncbi:hypothetical protein MMC25_006421 [Agyrium rufum]|nr:hypothetical protein [Agyrium rufum]